MIIIVNNNSNTNHTTTTTNNNNNNDSYIRNQIRMDKTNMRKPYRKNYLKIQ